MLHDESHCINSRMENWRIFLRIQWNKKQISGGLRISCVFERESPSNNSTAMGIKWYGQFEIMTIHRRIISWVMVLSLVHRTRTIQFLKRRRQEKATNIRNILHNTSIFTAKVPSNRVKYTTYRRKPLTKCIIFEPRKWFHVFLCAGVLIRRFNALFYSIWS